MKLQLPVMCPSDAIDVEREVVDHPLFNLLLTDIAQKKDF